MSTITKEWLQQKIADMEATRDEIPFGLGEDGTNTLAAMKLALASLEAEDKLSSFVASQESLGGDFERVLAENIEELYVPGISVPPAPVSVPDDEQGKPHPVMAVKGEPGFLDNFDRIISERDEDIDIGQLGSSNYEALMLAALDAFRAAMLHGADTELQRKAEIHDALCEKYNVESLADFVDWQRNHIAELEAAPPTPVGPGEAAVMPDYTGYTMTQRECYQAGKKAGLAEAGNSPVIPDGWKLVPVELTGAMTNAMTDAILDDLHNVDVWRSVLAAAPRQEA